jgi:uncharacterized protein GlcG (DUF336 family)
MTNINSVPTASVSRAAASALVTAALDAVAAAGFEAAVAVVDQTGYLRAFERSDGTPFLAVDIAIDKAWTAASFGYPTHAWNDLVANPKIAPLAFHPRLTAVGGGLPLWEDGKLIGAIGISGGSYEQDQLAAEAAMKKLGFSLPG